MKISKKHRKIIIFTVCIAILLSLSACKPKVDVDERGTESDKPADQRLINEDERDDTVIEPTDSEPKTEVDEIRELGLNHYNSEEDARAFERLEAPDSEVSDRSIMGIPRIAGVRTEDDGDILVIINKYHAVSDSYRPEDMVPIPPEYGTWNDMELKKDAYDAFLLMHGDAKDKGFNLKICSAYRSYTTQQYLYKNSLASYGKEATYVRSAYPGRSEHHTGLAIDITSASMGWGLRQDFADYEDGKWLDEHCADYGYIIRYPEGSTEITGYMYEPWHLRYVGRDVAEYITKEGLTLEEYLGEYPNLKFIKCIND